MEPLFLAVSSPGILFVGTAVFVILFTVILITLRRAKVFPGFANVSLAICASLLAVIGIMRTFSGAPSGAGVRESSGQLDFILLPYTAMGISMLLVFLLPLLGRLLPRVKKAADRTKPCSQDGYAEQSKHAESDERSAPPVNGKSYTNGL